MLYYIPKIIYIKQTLWPYIHSYEADGLLEVLSWKLPVPTASNRRVNYYGQLLAFHDCLYRARTHSRYVAIVDLDELLVPMRQRNWVDLIDYVQRENRLKPDTDQLRLEQTHLKPDDRKTDSKNQSEQLYNVFIFQCVFFKKEWPMDRAFRDNALVSEYHLRTLLYTKREAKTWKYPHRSKLIFDPNALSSVELHDIMHKGKISITLSSYRYNK